MKFVARMLGLTSLSLILFACAPPAFDDATPPPAEESPSPTNTDNTNQ